MDVGAGVVVVVGVGVGVGVSVGMGAVRVRGMRALASAHAMNLQPCSAQSVRVSSEGLTICARGHTRHT